MMDLFFCFKNKKVSVLSLLMYGFGIIACLNAIKLGMKFIPIQEVSELISLLEEIDFHYFGRIVERLVRTGIAFENGVDFYSIVFIGLDSISNGTWGMIVLYFMFVFSKKHMEKRRIGYTFLCFFLFYMIILFFVCGSLMRAYQLSSVSTAMRIVRFSGYGMIIGYGVFGIYFIYRIGRMVYNKK